jgi:hypothetical protein
MVVLICFPEALPRADVFEPVRSLSDLENSTL